MKKRFITALVIVLVLLPLILINALDPVFKIVFLILAAVASFEMLSMYFKTNKISLKLILGMLFTIALTIFYGQVFNFKGVELTNTLKINVIILLAIIVILALFTTFDKNMDAISFSQILGTTLYVGLGIGSIILIKSMGIGFLLYALIIASMTDVFAYLFGIKFGKTKMAPTISPKKSFEGAIAGTIIATVIGSLFAYFYGTVFKSGSFLNQEGFLYLTFLDVERTPKFMIALLITSTTTVLSIVGQLGDLFASKLKRTYEIKDFGKIFPGHGGVLDRLDSTIFISLVMMIMAMLSTYL